MAYISEPVSICEHTVNSVIGHVYRHPRCSIFLHHRQNPSLTTIILLISLPVLKKYRNAVPAWSHDQLVTGGHTRPSPLKIRPYVLLPEQDTA